MLQTRRDAFQAIADPTRRQIIAMVARDHSLNVNSIADQFDMSRQAISLHIKILAECGLVTIQQKGRERICEAKLDSLSEVAVWVEQYKKYWESHLDSLEMYLDKLQKNKKHVGKRNQHRK
jgi:DNA-binding transcriptional ArsR family regulator